MHWNSTVHGTVELIIIEISHILLSSLSWRTSKIQTRRKGEFVSIKYKKSWKSTSTNKQYLAKSEEIYFVKTDSSLSFYFQSNCKLIFHIFQDRRLLNISIISTCQCIFNWWYHSSWLYRSAKNSRLIMVARRKMVIPMTKQLVCREQMERNFLAKWAF